MWKKWGWVLALGVVLPAGSVAGTQDRLDGEELTQPAQEAIRKGIRWLLDNQDPEGSWG